MHEDEKRKSIIEKKCPSCYKKDWCMLLPSQIPDCLGPFMDVEDNLKKYREWYEKDRKPKADIDKAVREVVKSSFERKKEIFDDRYGGGKKQ